MSRHCRYSCDSAANTLEWINAINDFLRLHRSLLDAHVVNFFKDRLWESIDKQWIDCLRRESVENLLKIPSGIVQDCWPASLKEFVLTLRSLVLPREQADLQIPGMAGILVPTDTPKSKKIYIDDRKTHPLERFYHKYYLRIRLEALSKMLPDLHLISLSGVLSQGMNLKKKHEVEILGAIVSSVAKSVAAQTIIDVGAGQGYLAQVLSFQYQLSVVAIDASSHHGEVTTARAERIKKHYAAKMRKSQASNRHLNAPQTVTCCVLSSDMLKALSDTLLQRDNDIQVQCVGEGLGKPFPESLEADMGRQPSLCKNPYKESSLVLAGLHACGDLSVTMLRTFLECKEVKAVVSIGCCYNLLSEEGYENTGSQCGFPMSESAKLAGLSLGKNARDLACQSAERWRSLTRDAALQNFELHAFRAAFQMVLYRYYPEVLTSSPSIGRQGKALRRQRLKRVLHGNLDVEKSTIYPLATPEEHCNMKGSCPTRSSVKAEVVQGRISDLVLRDGDARSTSDIDTLSPEISSNNSMRCEGTQASSVDRYSLFEKFCESGLCRLGLISSQEIDFLELWNEAQPFAELVGPYWSLRAALGPLLETLLLLDRLLFLQEQGNSVGATVLPVFNPTLSPRNVAIIARKN